MIVIMPLVSIMNGAYNDVGSLQFRCDKVSNLPLGLPSGSVATSSDNLRGFGNSVNQFLPADLAILQIIETFQDALQTIFTDLSGVRLQFPLGK